MILLIFALVDGSPLAQTPAAAPTAAPVFGSTDYIVVSLCDAACFIPELHVSVLFSAGSTNPPRRRTSWIRCSSSVNIRRSRCFYSTSECDRRL
ncbi:hypothetical protein OROGR_008814 [Orobanche gracilis]